MRDLKYIDLDDCHTGRYVQRDNEFKSMRFTFNLNTCEAYSYDWWLFVKRVDHTIYFNNASYSMETSKHQEMAMNILALEQPKKHGLKVKTVYIKEGLNHLDRAIINRLHEIETLKAKIAAPRTHKKTNAWRVERIKEVEKDIAEIKEMQKLFTKNS